MNNLETIKDIKKNIFAMEYAKNESVEATKESLLIMEEQILKELNKEIQDILNSDQLQNIINSSVSKKEAQSKINSFIK